MPASASRRRSTSARVSFSIAPCTFAPLKSRSALQILRPFRSHYAFQGTHALRGTRRLLVPPTKSKQSALSSSRLPGVCVWRNDSAILHVLTRRSPLAASFLTQDGDSILINEPVRFDRASYIAHRGAMQARIRSIENMPSGVNGKHCRFRIGALRRMNDHWNPLAKRHTIAGIRLNLDQTT